MHNQANGHFKTFEDLEVNPVAPEYHTQDDDPFSDLPL